MLISPIRLLAGTGPASGSLWSSGSHVLPRLLSWIHGPSTTMWSWFEHDEVGTATQKYVVLAQQPRFFSSQHEDTPALMREPLEPALGGTPVSATDVASALAARPPPTMQNDLSDCPHRVLAG